MADLSSAKETQSQQDALKQIDLLRKERDEMLALIDTNSLKNVTISRRDHESNKSALKSDLKKTQAFVKKLKSINVEGLQQCIRDAETLNLNLYISEIVVAIAETSYKPTDVPSMVKLCIALHRRYDSFTNDLLASIRNMLLSAAGSTSAEEDKEGGKKKRILIRFAMELFQAGVWVDATFFLDLLKSLLGISKSKQTQATNTTGKALAIDMLSLGTFVKYGCEILLGFTPRKLLSLAQAAGTPVSDVPVKLLIPTALSEEMRNLVTDTYSQLCDELLKAHKEYRSMERRFEKDKLMHGSITEQKQQDLDAAKKQFEKLQSTVIGLAECADFDVPELKEDKEQQEEAKGISVWEGASTGAPAGTADYGPYGDAETKAFYEDLPDLLTLVPLSALGLTPEQAATLRETWKGASGTAKDGDEGDGNVEAGSAGDGSVHGGADSEATEEAALTHSTSGTALADAGKEDDGEGDDDGDDDEEDGEEGRDKFDDTPHEKLTTLLQERLPECINRQRADEFCVSFCLVNSRSARKRLVAALLKLPRSRPELGATYARIIASLNRIFPEIAKPILEALQKEFYGQFKNSKANQNIDWRIRNVRFLAELIKFAVAPPITAFKMFKLLLSDFSSANIEVISVFMESCGRFLYLLPHTHGRMNETLETILRLRRVKHLGLRQQTLLEMAYFAVKPPERVKQAKVEYTMAQKYARYLIIEKLDSRGAVVDDVILSIRKLPWVDPTQQIDDHVTQAVLHLARNKYVSIPVLADCLSGLAVYLPNLVIRITDRLFEEVQRSLDVPYKREPQSQLGFVRLLGELYNFEVLSSAVIFDLLYHTINYGHNVPADSSTNPAGVPSNQPNQSTSGVSNTNEHLLRSPSTMHSTQYYDPRVFCEKDLPNDLFRAQIVCEILNTCGSYYVIGRTKDKLIQFLTYFQRYLMTKSAIPMHVEFAILDTLDNLEEMARAAVIEAERKRLRAAAGKGKKRRDVKEKEVEVVFKEMLLPRYETFDAVNAVISSLESAAVGTSVVAEEAQEHEDEDDEADGARGATKQRSDSRGSIDDDDGDSDDDGSDEGSSDEESEDGDEEEQKQKEEDEENERLSNQRAAQLLEKMRAKEADDEFERAFKSLMSESVESAKVLGTSKATVDINRMAIPAVLPKPKNVLRSFQEDDDEEEAPRGMAFKLLAKDGKGRIETRQLMVPEEAPMAIKLQKAEAAARAEKQRLKEKVLQMESLNELETQQADIPRGGFNTQRRQFTSVAPTAPYQQQSYQQHQQQPYHPPHQHQQQPPSAGGRGYGGGAPQWRAGPGAGVSSGFNRRTGEEDLNLDQFLSEADAAERRRLIERTRQQQPPPR